ncbi:MAG: AAA family ATPase [Thermodesulfobacteriota bacterium]|jgi:type II secretory pathway predicted ATPase ExeA
MPSAYRQFFALTAEPFGADVARSQILATPAVSAVEERVHYALGLGAIALVTGEVGSGKSTALRYAVGGLHPSEVQVLAVTASSGSILELYRLVLAELGHDAPGSSRAQMTRIIRREVLELARAKKRKTLLVIDEASLLRLEVLTELHTLTQFEHDSKPYLPLVLAGQANLADHLQYRTALPLASRVVARSHLKGIDQKTMEEYLRHHLRLAGVERILFEDAAITAIHQGSGGLFRKANHLARGALIAAAHQQAPLVSAEHVRIAATELF